jgi:hypothetical protein
MLNIVFELDRTKVEARAEAAELAINAHVFAGQQHISGDERLDMRDALSALRVLKLEGEHSAVGELKSDDKS